MTKSKIMNKADLGRLNALEREAINNTAKPLVKNYEDDEFFEFFRKIKVTENQFSLTGMIAFATEYLDTFLEEQAGGDVTIILNSDGGFASEGLMMYQRLKDYPGKVDTVGSVAVASAAVMPFIGGETRTMRTGAQLMIHPTSMMAFGNKTKFAQYIELLQSFDDSLVSIYAEADPRLEQIARDHIVDSDLDKVFTAQEALNAGFATALEEDGADVPAPAAPPVENADKDDGDCHLRLMQAYAGVKTA